MTSYPVKSVKVSYEVVETLVERGGAGVTEVADALGVPKSTAHDHLRTLEAVGYVVNESGEYRPSTKYLHVGETARNDHELYVNGREEALALHESTDGKYVQLVVEENGRCAVLWATARQRGSTASRGPAASPTHFYLHTNAPGKAIMAHLGDAAVEELLAEHGLPARTAATITDADRLQAELETVRERGFAVDEGELITGMTGLAAPIVADGEPRGAVAVYGPSGSFADDPASSDLPEAVQESARTIEANLIFTSE